MTVKELIEKLEQEGAERPERGSFRLPRVITGLKELGSATEVTAEFVPYLFQGIREELQLSGMGVSSGDAVHDDFMWNQLTKTLALVREVLVREFKVDLPEARVVSVVTEMMEDGLIEEVKEVMGEDGQAFLQPVDPYKLKVRIVKVPAGPAPEKFRRFWVGMELPARQGDYHGCAAFKVPMEQALELLQEKSPEAVGWFRENFHPLCEFSFGLDEVQVVQ